MARRCESIAAINAFHVKKEELPHVRQQCAAYRAFQQNLKIWRQLTASLEQSWKQLQQAQSK